MFRKFQISLVIFIFCSPVFAEPELSLEQRVSELEAQVRELNQLKSRIAPAVKREKQDSSCITRRTDKNFKINILAKEIKDAQKNHELSLSDLRGVPYFKDQRQSGVRIFAIRKDSLFDKLGFCNGDIIKSVESKKVSKLKDIFEQIYKAQEKEELSILFEKNLKEKSLNIDLKR